MKPTNHGTMKDITDLKLCMSNLNLNSIHKGKGK